MTNGISQQTVQELVGFLNSFVQNKNVRGSQVINLDYDTAKKHFYQNMEERGLAKETKKAIVNFREPRLRFYFFFFCF